MDIYVCVFVCVCVYISREREREREREIDKGVRFVFSLNCLYARTNLISSKVARL